MPLSFKEKQALAMSVEVTIDMLGPKDPEAVKALMDRAKAQFSAAHHTPSRLIANARTLIRLGPEGSEIASLEGVRFPFGVFTVAVRSDQKDGLVVMA